MAKKTKKSRIHRGLGTRPSAPLPSGIVHGWKVVPYTEAEMWKMQRKGEISGTRKPAIDMSSSSLGGLQRSSPAEMAQRRAERAAAKEQEEGSSPAQREKETSE